MINPENKKINPSGIEDGNDPNIEEVKGKESFKVDAIKTGKSKKKSTHDQPADEQMYESFDELREEERLNGEE